MGIASGVTHFVQSILEVIQGLVAAVGHFFQLAINGVIGTFQGLVYFIEGTLGFAFHNFFLIGTVLAIWFGYMLYTQRQGTAPVSRTLRQRKAQ